jgi:hypothetical protein
VFASTKHQEEEVCSRGHNIRDDFPSLPQQQGSSETSTVPVQPEERTDKSIAQQPFVREPIADSRRPFQEILEVTPECVKLGAPDGTLLHMNRAGLEMVGAAEPQEVLGEKRLRHNRSRASRSFSPA